MALLKYLIHRRWSDSALFEAEIDCDPDAPEPIKLGLAVRAAVSARANLADANLAGVKWRDGVPLTKPPIQIHGLRYSVTILDRHAQIGCHCLAIEEWEALTEEEVRGLEGAVAVEFWRSHRELLLSLAKANGRPIPTPEPDASAEAGAA